MNYSSLQPYRRETFITSNKPIMNDNTSSSVGGQIAGLLGAIGGRLLYEVFKEDKPEASDQKDYLYHYTTVEGAVAILQCNWIYQSKSNSSKGVVYGVCLSSASPEMDKSKILTHSQDQNKQNVRMSLQSRSGQPVAMCFRFPKSHLHTAYEVPHVGRDAWLYPSNLHLIGIRWELMETQPQTNSVDGTTIAETLGAFGGLMLYEIFKQPEEEVFLYYYTSVDEAVGIIQNRLIHKSTHQKFLVSYEGVCLTTEAPAQGKSSILTNNNTCNLKKLRKRLASRLGRRVTAYFRFRNKELHEIRKVPALGPNLWLYPSHVRLNGVGWDLGETEGEVPSCR